MDVALYTLRQGRGGELTLSCVGSEGVGGTKSLQPFGRGQDSRSTSVFRNFVQGA